MTKKKKVKTKYRLEYWLNGRKFVRTFGSRGQAVRFTETLSGRPQNIEIRPFQEKEEVR